MPQRSCCSPDTGVLYGTGQTVANVPGIMVTVGGAALVRIFNSWLPLFLGIAGIEVVAAALFATVAQIKPQHLGPQEQPALDEEEDDDEDEDEDEEARIERLAREEEDAQQEHYQALHDESAAHEELRLEQLVAEHSIHEGDEVEPEAEPEAKTPEAKTAEESKKERMKSMLDPNEAAGFPRRARQQAKEDAKKEG